MATHSRILGWRIPCTEEPGGLRSIGSHKVLSDQLNNSYNFTVFDISPSTDRHNQNTVSRMFKKTVTLHIKYINKNVPYTSGSYAQYLITSYTGKESETHIHTHTHI